MRDLKHVNAYQQLLLSALALVHEADLIAIFRALRKHPNRGKCIDLVNAELDKGISLMAALAEPSLATRKKASSERKGGKRRITYS